MINQARRLLLSRSRNLTYEIISNKTGLTISWLRSFARSAINDPSASKLETLISFLDKEKDNAR
jgi:transcriptional regulator with XRE-family HTH domain